MTHSHTWKCKQRNGCYNSLDPKKRDRTSLNWWERLLRYLGWQLRDN